jgi:hypothetical protein
VYGKNSGCGGTLEWVRYNIPHQQSSNIQVRTHCRWSKYLASLQLAAERRAASDNGVPCAVQDAQGFWGCSNFKAECDYRESVPARHLSPQLAFEIISPTTFEARLHLLRLPVATWPLSSTCRAAVHPQLGCSSNTSV